MSKCRACLKSLRNMIPFDEKYIMYFNILTNLDLKLSTNNPQQLCKYCFETLERFIDFRVKCIAANTVFSDIILDESIKQEVTSNDDFSEIEVKQELKIDDKRINLEDDIVDNGDNVSNCDENFTYDMVFKTEVEAEDMKESKIVRKRKRKKKCATNKKKNKLGENTKSKVIKTETLEGKNVNYKTSDTSLSCGLCSKSFEDKIQLDSHILTHKHCNTCSICEERFMDWQELIAHRVNHLPQKRHPCHLCPQKFKTALYMEHHFRTNHHSEGERQTLRCKLCQRHYRTPTRIQSHFVETHNSKNKAFYCDQCNRLCLSKTILKAHIRTHVDSKPFGCDSCDFSCKNKQNLKLHKIYKHNPERAYCARCKKVFDSKTKKDQHICKQSEAICPVCGKILSCKSMLNRHLRTHDKNHWYKCDRCPAAFKGKTSLVVHMNKHDGIRKHECEFCSAKFYFASVLIKHRRTHTGIKPYVCKVCQKAFTGNHNLKMHMRVHGKFLINKKEPIDEEALLQQRTLFKSMENPRGTE